jgi:GTP-binding protein
MINDTARNDSHDKSDMLKIPAPLNIPRHLINKLNTNTPLTITLVGRPNVGKSSLFNRFLHRQHGALTFDRPGVTRDRNYGDFRDLNDELKGTGHTVQLVDTGGFWGEVNTPSGQSAKSGKGQLYLNPHNLKRNTDPLQKEISPKEQDLFERMVSHIQKAIEESLLVCLVVDGRQGLHPYDEVLMKVARNFGKEVIVLVNKMDSFKQEGLEADFFRLGVGSEHIFPISAAHGVGVDDVLRFMKKLIKAQNFLKINSGENQDQDQDQAEPVIMKAAISESNEKDVFAKLAIIGTPNSGKSTLLNYLLKEERALVAPFPGTTLDPINGYFDLFIGRSPEDFEKKKASIPVEQTLLELEEDDEEQLLDEVQVPVQVEKKEKKGEFWRTLKIVDTAGIRRKGQIIDDLEKLSVMGSMKSIDECDVVVYMVDAQIGITHQDSRLCEIILDKGKSLIIALNKMDLLERQLKSEKRQFSHDEKDTIQVLMKSWQEDMKDKVIWMKYCPIVTISAKTGKNIKRLKETLAKVLIHRKKPLPTGKLNRVLTDLVDKHSVDMPHSRGKKFKVKYASVVSQNPLTILIFSNLVKEMPPTYRRYLENGIREAFKLKGTPVRLIFRKPEQKQRMESDLAGD